MALSNNANRILVSIVAIPLIIVACYFGKAYFLILILAIAILSYYEFYTLALNKQMYANLPVGILGILILVVNQYFHIFQVLDFIILFIVVLSIIELFRNKGSAIYNLGATLLGTFYIGLFAGSLISIRELYPHINTLYMRGGYIIISILAAIWICDTAAFYGGTKFGKHKLFKRVSPNKSWEGAVFGFLFAILSMILAKIIVLSFLSWYACILFGIIIGTIGQLGDLIESLMKRDAGVKDSSNFIPGHGGIFDRFDSLLFTAPVIFLYLTYYR
jgi:phosphatidate cytidylyltransferase